MFFAVVMLVGATLSAPAALSTTIPVGDGPVAMAIDQRARIVFVVIVRGDSVLRIDARARQLMRTVQVGQLSRNIAVTGSLPGLPAAVIGATTEKVFVTRLAVDNRAYRAYVADSASNPNDGTFSAIDTFSMTASAVVTNGFSSDVSIVACDGALSRAALGSTVADRQPTVSGRSIELA